MTLRYRSSLFPSGITRLQQNNTIPQSCPADEGSISIILFRIVYDLVCKYAYEDS
jgi:hypothetical protein